MPEFEQEIAIQPAIETMPDFEIENHGSLFLVRPKTDAAMHWLVEHTDGQWFGQALAVEHRYIEGLAQGIIDDGFEIA